MSKTIIFAFVVMMAVAALAAPPQVLFEEAEANQEQEAPMLVAEEGAVRQPRITCDLLSGLGWNHSLCAAHCLVKGFAGGACNSNGVCVCRR